MGAEASTELSGDDIDEIKQNTKFKAGEIKEWHEKFLAEYPSGRIREPEFVEAYKQMFADGDATKYAHHVFRAYDSDGE